MSTRKPYSPEFKFQVVIEALTADSTNAEVARAYDVHPVTLSNWKRQFREDGAKVFGGNNELKRRRRRSPSWNA